MRQRHSREPLTLFPEALRICSTCKRRLPRDAFGKHNGNRDGLHSWCRECREARQDHLGLRRYYQLKHIKDTYGLDEAALNALLEAQGNACAICRRPLAEAGKGRHVDHDRITGKVRGLLCSKCNIGLGHANEDPQILRAMADYLELHQGKE